MSDRIIVVRPAGRLANQMFQLMLAAELLRRVGGARVVGYAMPEWGLIARPAPKGLTPGVILKGHRFDLDAAARSLLADAGRAVIIEGWGMRLEHFGEPALYRKLFQSGVAYPALRDNQLLINIRAEDILSGWHPRYFPLAFSFFEHIIDSTGLEPVFMGQIGEDAYSSALRRRFRGAVFLPSLSAVADFQTIRHAKHVVLSISSFAWLAAWLSETAQNIHIPIAGLYDPLKGREKTNLLPVDDPRYRFYEVDFPDMNQRRSLDLVSWAESACTVRARSGDEVRQLWDAGVV